MAVSFSVPSSPDRSVSTINTFYGCNLTDDEVNMNITQSPDCVNMVRDVPGKMRKAFGVKTKTAYNIADDYTLFSYAPIGNEFMLRKSFALRKIFDNAVGKCIPFCSYENSLSSGSHGYFSRPTDLEVVSPGTVANLGYPFYKIFNYNNFSFAIIDYNSNRKKCLIRLDTSPEKTGFPLVNNERIIYYAYGLHMNNEISQGRVSDFYVPLITIGRSPSGGGTSYEPVSLAYRRVKETFLGTASATQYVLSFTPNTTTNMVCEKLNSSGVWETISSSSYSLSGSTVTFTSAPGVSPITGQDNVRITYDLSNSTTLTGITGIGVCQTSNGYMLLAGKGNRLYYSYPNNTTYMPDINYIDVGGKETNIVGFANFNNKIVVFKDGKESANNIFLLDSELFQETDGGYSTVLKIESQLIGYGAISGDTICATNNEVLYLTEHGVYALCNSTYNNTNGTELRSHFINGDLLKHVSSFDKAKAVMYDNYFVLLVDGIVYLLDTTQTLSSDGVSSFSTKQYACFKRTFDNLASYTYTHGDFTYDLIEKIVGMELIEGELVFLSSIGLLYYMYDEANNDYAEEKGELYVAESAGRDIVALRYTIGQTGKYIPTVVKCPIYAKYETPDLVGSLFYKNKTLRYIAARFLPSVASSCQMWVMDHGLWTLIKEDSSHGYWDFAHFNFGKATFKTDKTSFISRTKTRIKKVDKFRIRISNNVIGEGLNLNDLGFEFIENGNYKG